MAAANEQWAEALMENLKLMQEQLLQMKLCSTPMHQNVNIPWPSALDVTIDPAEGFKQFKLGWNNYCIATGMDKWPPEDERKKVSILINVIGSEALKKYDHFNINENEMSHCEKVLDIMQKKLVAEKNVIYTRYMFNSRVQNLEEDFETFYTEIVKLVDECDYDKFRNDLLRDKIVIGIRDKALKKEMLRKKDLTLDMAVNLCRSNEATERQLRSLNSEVNVKKVMKKPYVKKRKCKYCGEFHQFIRGACPAYGKECEKCGKKNHSKAVCRTRDKKVKEISKAETDETESSDQSSLSDVINNINQIREKKYHVDSPQVVIKFQIGTKWTDIKCDVDTGADVDIIGYKEACSLFGKDMKMKKSDHKLYSFGGHKIKVFGQVEVLCKTKKRRHNNQYQICFQVVKKNHKPLLSCKTSQAMGLIKFCRKVETLDIIDKKETEKIIRKYEHLFEGYGKLPGEVNLEIDANIKPVIQKARRIPIALRAPLKNEIARLEQEGIIVKETNHTEWVSNILLLNRDSKLRVCLDPIPLNKAIKRPNYQFTTIDEILPELGKAKVFSTVEAKKGFWHLKLNEKSSKLTTFWTPYGRYRWKVLPFGINAAPEHFQQKMQEVINGLLGVEMMADDILIYGIGETIDEAIENHNKNLENLFQKLTQYNCKLNKQKMRLLQTSIKFYGHLFTTDGLKPDPSKVEAIKNICIPENKKDLLRFLGMLTYLSRFVPNLSTESRHLRDLTLDKTAWEWTHTAQCEFDRLKALISDIQTLKYYDISKPLILECDSSSTALGVVVYQEKQVVAYASRTLTATERRYAQIEKELLAILFACTRFDQYIIGNKKTIIKTDHKPLLNIFKKPLLQAPKRLQMMLLALQRYSFQLEFVSGKENIVADTLSRSFNDNSRDEISSERMHIQI